MQKAAAAGLPVVFFPEGTTSNGDGLLKFHSGLLAQAMQKAGTADDPAKVAKVLHDNKWETPRGVVAFDKNGQAESGPLINLVVKDGKLVPAP